MNTPDGTYVVGRAPRFDWASAGYPDGPSLDEEVLDAVAYVVGVTWRGLDATDPAVWPLPVGIDRLAARAVVLRTQQQVTQADPDNVEAASDELFSSSSAGGASETRRAFADYKSANEAMLVNKWPALNDLLWQVMTPEARSWWIAWLLNEMPAVPAAALACGLWGVIEIGWDAAHYSPYQNITPGYLLRPDAEDLPLLAEPYGGDDPLPSW